MTNHRWFTLVHLRITISIFLIAFNLTILNAQQTKPNIIIILADDLGYKALGCNGGNVLNTPNLDTMAKLGMRFTQCHSSPLCSPSRHMLLTGKYNFRTYTEWGVLNKNEKTIATLLRDSGYATSCYGKWQLDGGPSAIKRLGFNNFCVYNPFTPAGEPLPNRYKNPVLYTNNGEIDSSLTAGKYGEDIFSDSIFSFIDQNKGNPFFIYYPMTLPHSPYNPTPDDPNFQTWNTEESDTSYFSSMVKYMDKKVGQIIQKVKNAGLQNNTIIFFTSDNGSGATVVDFIDNGALSLGKKGLATESGTLAPMIAYCPTKISPSTINSNLIDFTDFFPTIASLSKVNISIIDDTLDGISFSPKLLGNNGIPREWIFNYYDHHPGNSKVLRWAQTKKYKLVDSLGVYLFYNFLNDPEQTNPKSDNILSPQEKLVKQQLLKVLNGYALQGPPTLYNSWFENATDSSVKIGSTIQVNSGVISERGTLCYQNENLFLPEFNKGFPVKTSGPLTNGPFTDYRFGLNPENNYFYRGYAISNNKIGMSPERNFYTLSKSIALPPKELIATSSENSIRLEWEPAIFPSTGASFGGYLIIFSNDNPVFATLPDGKRPEDVIRSGKIGQLINFSLPGVSPSLANISQLKTNTTYSIILVPYTWDGIHPGTYNYLENGILKINTKTKTRSVNIFPNPTKDEFNIVVNLDSNAPIGFSVTNGVGQKVYAGSASNNSKIRFGKKFPNGTYFVTIIQEKYKETFKIIKVAK